MKKQLVRKFWNRTPCGSDYTDKKIGTREFFEESEKIRFDKRNHFYLKELIDFKKFKGKKVLEIGVGIGIDAKQFAQNGAIFTGIDLTPNAVKISKKLFKMYNLKGDFSVADAENLPFEDNFFDVVYSCGVLHHTPNTKETIKEVYRVLKPGGQAIIMLYNKQSRHYLIDILLYRHIIRLGFVRQSFQDTLNQNTDGVENPLSKAYSRKGVRKLFSQYKNIRTKARYLVFPDFFDKICPYKLRLLLSKIMGWNLFIFAEK
jgi:ubiquinone/menaquinone biosynthesis C-methylase UbiE